jgi:hypothetical protein
VLGTNVWRMMLGVDRATVIEAVEVDEIEDAVVAHVRPRRAGKRRCGRCGRRAPGYDQGEGRRRWRALDSGTLRLGESESDGVKWPHRDGLNWPHPGTGFARCTSFYQHEA